MSRPPKQTASDRALQTALEHHRAGRLPDAEVIYRQILADQPNHADALNLFGLLAQQVGRLDIAHELIGKAVAVSPRFAEAHNNLASVVMAQGDLAQAEIHYRRAIALAPGHVGARVNLGNLLWQSGRFDDAAALCREAIRLAPATAEAHNNLANALKDLGDLQGAIDSCRRAVALKPDYAAAHNNLANALCDLGDPATALTHYERALQLEPSFADYHMNRGNALRDLGRLSDAVSGYERALTLNPQLGDAHWNMATALLVGGDFARGWVAFRKRWQTRRLAPHRRSFAVPQWDGTDPAGRTILVYAEQGLGDVMQFCRYLPLLRDRGARTVLLIDGAWRQLAPLLRSLDGVDQLALELDEVVAFDLQCPLLDLPLLLDTRLETIPTLSPYLAADPARRGRHASLVDDGTPRIGLVWAGNRNNTRDRLRSMPLTSLLPLLDLPGLRWFGLQVGDGHRDLDGRSLPASFTDLGPALHDFADTAAVMAELDLVVTVDTSVAHLAGALGRPTWVLLPTAPDWRWLLARADSPWYPTARLFRQPSPGAWDAVVEQLRDELSRLAVGDRSRLLPPAAV
ncbi:MAG: tetratricopeptide repeat-containing glycosyltransferase family protein [Pseudomonadota bacterium]